MHRHREEAIVADPQLILVVDDEPSYRDALSVALQREGFAVDTAADGVEALERFEASRPALVLLDVMLPRMSGVDVCREIRSTSRTPIIMRSEEHTSTPVTPISRMPSSA